MMAAQTDFWGEIGSGDVRSPLAILREQAALLGGKTSNLVEATVSTNVLRDEFIHNFELVVPSMNHYTYELFWVKHGIDLYPITVPPGNRNLATEEQFIQWLRVTLSSETTKKIIANLLAQVTS